MGEDIQVKLKAVQKYESPSKKMEEPKMIVDKKDYMKYGPSDEEEWLSDRFKYAYNLMKFD